MATDPTYQTLNYSQQGGKVWVIGGELQFAAGSKITNAGTQASAITALTDSTGGTASGTLAAIAAGASYAQADLVAIKNALASIAAQNAAIITALRGVGILP